MASVESAIAAVITTTLRPLVKLLLRYGVTHTDLTAILRRVYVDVALTDFKLPGRKQSDARIAVLTGLSRKEVKKVRSKELPESPQALMKQNRASWALSAWLRDKSFLDETGNPRSLSVREEDPDSFSVLAKKYCGDVPVRAVLDELIHVGAVRVVDNTRVEPTSIGYISKHDTSELLRVSLQNVADHIATIDYNDQNKPHKSRLELVVKYDNVTQTGTDAFRALSRDKAKSLLAYLDNFLAIHDLDTNDTHDETSGNRTGLGIYYFEDDADNG